MKGYIVANISVTDTDAYEAYRSQTGAIIAQYGGRALVKGGAIQVREGEPGLSRLVILEFPSVEAAATFYDSPEYQAIVPIRHAFAESTLCIVDGVE
ncbi:MAG TPA: DUF1330 domain-containing protein [Allosphingosinicella sp.]|jgi:uncharacterized protein (DUF1330 family)